MKAVTEMAKRDNVRIVAETLANLVTTGGAVAATVSGAPPLAVAMAKGILDGTSRLVISKWFDHPDPQQSLDRIRNERTSQTAETFRSTLEEAMGLRPDFEAPIDALADAIEAHQDGQEDSRYQQALLMLFETVVKSTALLTDIKSDTSHIPAIKNDTTAILESVTQITAMLSSTGSPPSPPSAVTTYHLQKRVETLTAELRSLHDSKGQDRWEAINKAIALHSWQHAFSLSNEMEQWLDDQGDKLSPDTKGHALLTLLDVALIRHSGLPWMPQGDTAEAWRILSKAEVVLGSTPSEDSSQRLLRTRAKLTFIDGNHEAALQLLATTTGPATIAFHLAFLTEQKRFGDASELAVQQPEPHARWADDAMVAHIRAANHERAEALLNWAKRQPLDVRQVCVLAFARETYSEITGHGSPAAIIDQQESQRVKLRELLTLVRQTFASAVHEGPHSGIDAEALALLILFGHVLKDKDICRRAADSLSRGEPASPELGRAVLRGNIAPIAGLSDRYLKDYPDIFMFQMLVAMLLTEADGQPDRALEFLRPLLSSTTDTSQQKAIGTAVLIAAYRCSKEKTDEALRDLENALGHAHRLPTILRASLLADANDLLAASSELATVADEQDHIWLQVAAGVAAKRKEWQSAAGYFRKLGAITGQAEPYSDEAHAWHRAADMAKEVDALEIANRLEPHQPKILQHLAAAYHNLDRYRDAINVYAQLWATTPRDARLALYYSRCLALSGDISQAVEVLTEYIDITPDQIDVDLLLMRAQSLMVLGKPLDALNSLLPYWEKLSVDHHYLMQIIRLGYAANREQHAHNATNKLLALQHSGQLPEPVLHPFTMDEMLQWHEKWRKQQQTIHEQYLSGRLPWISASQWIEPSGHCLLSWRTRTQYVVPSDHPNDLAKFSIYATNSFTIRAIDGVRHLDRLCAPKAGSIIVADISALITLHRLGLLRILGTYFTKILVPASYKIFWFEEQSQIPHRQPSQITTRQAIVAAVKDRKVSVIAKENVDSGTPILDEYDKPVNSSKPIIRIRQLAHWMARSGKLASHDLNRIETMPHEPELLTTAQAEALLNGGKLLATTFTLQTINDWGLLGSLSDCIHVMIEQDDLQNLETELHNQAFFDEAGDWHILLTQTINQLPNVEFVGLAKPDKNHRDNAAIHYGVDATLLAIERNLPLLADDRLCQQKRLSVSDTQPGAAFGTDCLLEQLATHKIIDAEQHADHYLQLIGWRYKFCLPTANILLTLADRYKNASPGDQLRQVASYMQDCMRDAGLFGGAEPTEPPIPMAWKLFAAWTDVVTAFLVRLWQDPRFTEFQATKITKWTSRYFRPARPKNMVIGSWRTISQSAIYSLLGKILTHLLQQADIRKARKLVNRLRRSTGIGRDDVIATHSSVVESMRDVYDLSKEKSRRAVGSAFLRIHDILYENHSLIDWRLLPMAETLNIVSAIDAPSARFMKIISDCKHATRMEPRIGPYVYIREDGGSSMPDLPDMLCSAITNLRRAALTNLLATDGCPKSPRTQALLAEYADAIRAESADQWVPAVSTLLDSINEDFELNVAGFKQAHIWKHDELQYKSWKRVIFPTPESLLSIECDGWLFLQNSSNAATQLIERLQNTSTLEELVQEYDSAIGHLALASPLDLGTKIRDFITARDDATTLWSTLSLWLNDKAKPWHQYHACQALLVNLDFVPIQKRADVWEAAGHIVGLLQVKQCDSDEAQVWRLERDLAAHYLHILDVSGFSPDDSRAITISWWAAKQAAGLLTDGLSEDQLPTRIRRWRENFIHREALLIRDTWSWLAPKTYSAGRLATYFSISPLSSAILLTIGDCVKAHDVNMIPKAVRDSLQYSFCEALLTTDTREKPKESRLWAWDDSMTVAAENFISNLPSEEQAMMAIQIIGHVKKLYSLENIKTALKQLPSSEEMDAIFVCSRIRMFCHDHAEAADFLLECLRDMNWRNSLATNLPSVGWTWLAQSLLFLQARQGLEWNVELPYAFLHMAEATSNDPERAEFFIRHLVISSLSGSTMGAIKSLKQSKKWPELRNIVRHTRKSIERLRSVSRNEIVFRFQDVCTLLEQL